MLSGSECDGERRASPLLTLAANFVYARNVDGVVVSLPTFREVFKAKHRQTGKKVALKKVLMENEKEGVRSLCLI